MGKIWENMGKMVPKCFEILFFLETSDDLGRNPMDKSGIWGSEPILVKLCLVYVEFIWKIKHGTCSMFRLFHPGHG
jgi:hypothetical protein